MQVKTLTNPRRLTMKRSMIPALLISFFCCIAFAGCGEGRCGGYYITKVETATVAESSLRSDLVLAVKGPDAQEVQSTIGAKGEYEVGPRRDLPNSVCVQASVIGSTAWQVEFGKFDPLTLQRQVVIQVNQANQPFCLTTEQIKLVFEFNPYSCDHVTSFR